MRRIEGHRHLICYPTLLGMLDFRSVGSGYRCTWKTLPKSTQKPNHALLEIYDFNAAGMTQQNWQITTVDTVIQLRSSTLLMPKLRVR